MPHADKPNPPAQTRTQRWNLLAGFLRLMVIPTILALALSWLPRPAWTEPASIVAESRGQSLAFVAIFLIRTFTFHAGLALLVAAAIAILIRRRGFATFCIIIGLAIAGLTFGPFTQPQPPKSTSQETVRILSMNMLYGSGDTQVIKGIIDRESPDVIVFQEFTPQNWVQFGPLLRDQYPFSVNAGREDAFGQAVFSKLPFTGPATPYPPRIGQGLPERAGGFVGLADPQIRFTVRHPGGGTDGTLTVQNTHLVPPTGANLLREQRMQCAWLSEVGVDFRDDPRRGLVLIGDFNFTKESPQATLFRRSGLVEAHSQAGSGRGTTWPATTFLRFFPGVRIDQAYSTGAAHVVASRVLEPTGSDHRPIVVDVAWTLTGK